MFRKHPYDNQYNADKRHIRVDASEIIHAYLPNRAEQTRGVSFIAPVMANMKQYSAYMEAEIVSARISASKMGFYITPSGTEYVGDLPPEEEFAPVQNASAGTFEQLPSGFDFKAFDPQHPTTAFDSFTKTVMRSVASGLNISYHALTNDLTSVNYSSIRKGA